MAFIEDSESLCCINCRDEKMVKVQCDQNLTVDQCPKCGGLWLDSGELINLFKLGDFYIKNLDTSEKQNVDIKDGVRECPVCRTVLQLMKNNKAPEVKIDRCPSCKGVWLDRGELFKLGKLYGK
jgi:Zn-finger nucleic acid-binding protein